MLISEIAKMAGLSKDGIRHYEELGLIVSTPRQAGSKTYRDYSPSVLKTVENIRALQRLGLSLHEIGPILKISAAGYTQKQMMGFLEGRLKVVREKIAALGEIETYISGKLKTMRKENKASSAKKSANKGVRRSGSRETSKHGRVSN
jgi:DNA-binding transcriptional MerR regulator